MYQRCNEMYQKKIVKGRDKDEDSAIRLRMLTHTHTHTHMHTNVNTTEKIAIMSQISLHKLTDHT